MNTLDTPPPKKRGCFFYGCITCVILFVVVGIAAFFIARSVVNWANTTLAEYTDDKPMVLPKVEMSADERHRLQQRLSAFNDAVQAQSNTPPLILTGREVNALIGTAPEMKELTNYFFITVESNQIRGDVSLPLEKYFRVPFIKFKGRYLNGSGTFNVAKSNGTLLVSIESLESKGKPLPQQQLAQLRHQNLADEFNKNPTNRASLEDYESIEVTNSTIVIRPKKY
ncbi:MAG: hypothetical protein JWQ71_3424 [Pedosphaera sp.]|nr:hypothetical protein [Pedosphaera sp.]